MPVPRPKSFLWRTKSVRANFVERARKRVSRVVAVISTALEQKVVCEKEVQQSEE